MTMEDQLVRRLERMTLPPAPRDLAARAVAAAREPARPRRRRSILVVAAAAIVIAGGAMAATWPAPLRTLGDVPAFGPFSHRAAQALGATGAPPVRQDSATASGYTVRVSSAYDDGNRVILVLRVDRADGRPGPANEQLYATTGAPSQGLRASLGMGPALTGADGQPLLATTSLGDGHECLLFFSRPAHGPAAGTSLTLHADRVMEWIVGGRTITPVAGDWTLHFQARPSRAPRDLPPPAPVSAGPIRVQVTAVRISDAYLDVRFDATGPGDQVDRLAVSLLAPDGSRAQPIDSAAPRAQTAANSDPGTRTDHDDLAWQLAGAGTYRLTFQAPDGRQLALGIAVPHGRAAGVPGLTQATNPFCCG